MLRSNCRFILAFLLVFFAFSSKSLHANIINVPGDVQTIQAAIDRSQDGDTVLVQPGEYSENIDFNGHNIVVGSLYLTTGDTSYVENTIIDGDENDTVVIIASGEGEETVLTGFTLQNGSGVLGGGIFCRASNPRLDHLIIRNNYSRHQGGGIYIDRCACPLITNTSVTDNSSYVSSSGGGIYCTEKASPIIRNSIISNNTGYYGGGIALVDSSSMYLTNVSISENFADDYGAGIYCDYHCHLTLNNVQITGNGHGDNDCYNGGGIHCSRSEMDLINVSIVDNHCLCEGAGILCELSTINIVNSLILRNSTDGSGGGMMIGSRSNITLNRVIVAYNFADEDGGGIYHCPRYSGEVQLNMTFVVIALNFAGSDGGGLYLSNSSNSAFVNSIMWDNSPQQVYSPRDGELNCLSVSHSSIEGGEDRIEDNHNLDINWLDGNLFGQPHFVDPDNDDFNLAEDSPCVESGTAFFVLNGDTLVNLAHDEYNGIAPDMGAMESEFTGIDNVEKYLPAEFTLYPAYPNPFNSTTTITFGLGKPAPTQLALYDLSGREVMTLYDGYQQAGFHSVNLNAGDLASGLYFVRLDGSGQIMTQKLMLIR
ncbi:T9SS type A sorting domain-containing protein [bacterium]|nr:T9SS type A sorting domain-containing protein [bacterium]